jgi:hypothetical protein
MSVVPVCSSLIIYTTNQEIHGVNTRHNIDLHFTTARLTAFKEGAYFFGMKIFNHLHIHIKRLSNKIELFKPVLKRYLLLQSFYSLEEYFNYNNS